MKKVINYKYISDEFYGGQKCEVYEVTFEGGEIEYVIEPIDNPDTEDFLDRI